MGMAIYSELFGDILPPTSAKKIFQPASSLLRLEIVFIELRPDVNRQIISNLYNIANVYGGKGVALSIVVSREQFAMVDDVLQSQRWRHVNLIVGPTISQVSDYSALLETSAFWSQFRAEYVLVTQTDVMLFREVTDEFWGYDYIGAPWDHDPFVWYSYELKAPLPETLESNGHRKGGNGGYSLRKLQKLISMGSASEPNPYSVVVPEDIFWARTLDTLAPESVAFRFSFEQIRSDDPEIEPPTGMHQLWHLEMMGNFFRAFVSANPSRGA
ncbi:hypothetical protein HDU91_006615 [Kappamyces sp. JEL0680]|nr:hypothetical protein HDU91_006615 [Kappamyces sp. JEL0680]